MVVRNILFVLCLLFLSASGVWAIELDVDDDGKIDAGYLPTVDLFQSGDPAEPTLGQMWWNNSTNQLKVAGALGVYAFNATSMVAWDTTPTAFTFTDVTGADLETVYTSAPITVAGINWPAPISVSGDATAKYSINNATATATNGTVELGEEVRAVVTSSASGSTAVNATVTIGGVGDAYSVTTEEITTGRVGHGGSGESSYSIFAPVGPSVTVWRYQANATGDVSRMTARYYGSTQFNMAIYSDNAGEPGTLLGVTANATGDWVNQWLSANLNATVTIQSGTYYWVGVTTPNEFYAFFTKQAGEPVRSYGATSFPSTWPTESDVILADDRKGGAIYADHP
jgi:hypothetical protein